MIILEISNTCDLGVVLYQFGFKQRLILDAIITQPDYDSKEEGVENGNRYFNKTFQQLKKRYRMDFIATEYIIDALTLLPLHDYVTLHDGSDAYEIADIVVEYEWEGVYAVCTLGFTVTGWNKTIC